MDLRQAAMPRINPPTALLLLTDIVTLKPGDWLIQNVANSAVGRLLIPLARRARRENHDVVRRESLFKRAEGAGRRRVRRRRPRSRRAVKAQTGGAPIRLGLDAVSGRATARLSPVSARAGSCATTAR